MKLVACPPRHYTCFHCEETFTSVEAAREHFGSSSLDIPTCQVDAAHLRELEKELFRYREEDSDLHREIHDLYAKHNTDLMREEEKGYASGLADGMKLTADQLRAAQVAVLRKVGAEYGESEKYPGPCVRMADELEKSK